MIMSCCSDSIDASIIADVETDFKDINALFSDIFINFSRKFDIFRHEYFGLYLGDSITKK